MRLLAPNLSTNSDPRAISDIFESSISAITTDAPTALGWPLQYRQVRQYRAYVAQMELRLESVFGSVARFEASPDTDRTGSGAQKEAVVWSPAIANAPETRFADLSRVRWLTYVASRLLQMAQHNRQPNEIYPDVRILQRAWSEAIDLFHTNTPTPSVVPSDDGGVLFIWHKGGWDLEIEVRESSSVVWGRTRKPQNATQLEGDLSRLRPQVTAVLRSISTD